MNQNKDCVFCNIVRKIEFADIVYEDSLSLAFLDRYPQTTGHLQLIPKKHHTWIYEVPEMGKLFTTVQRIIRAIMPVLGADHVSLATYGHEVKHAHIWIVPQYTRVEKRGEWNQKKSLGNGQQDMAHMLQKAIAKEVSV